MKKGTEFYRKELPPCVFHIWPRILQLLQFFDNFVRMLLTEFSEIESLPQRISY